MWGWEAAFWVQPHCKCEDFKLKASLSYVVPSLLGNSARPV